jgi:hypothetical protein
VGWTQAILGLASLCAALGGVAAREGSDALWVRGMTVTTRTSGREWATDAFAAELERLRALGVNWVAIHPYARIQADGSVRWRALDPDHPPEFLARPIREAHRRGMSILIHPHLAHWGSPFNWRGAIDFTDPQALARFFSSYGAWITALAEAAGEADGFVVGSELDRLVAHQAEWRALIQDVRAVSRARLTYASNWTDFDRVPFWDALDAVGVQAYFPLSSADHPRAQDLERGWDEVIARLEAVHRRTGKPVVLTELGYDLSLDAAREPWAWGRPPPPEEVERALALQRSCLEAALAAIAPQREWLRGAFLWKWFVGAGRRGDFDVDTPLLREVVRTAWGG